MPATTSNKGIAQGWNLGEGGWKAGMDENMLRLSAMVRHSWAQDRENTDALNFAYFGGMLLIADVWTRIDDDVVALTDGAVNYVEVSTLGVVSANIVGFSADQSPVAIVTTAAGAITDVVDARSEVSSLGELLAFIDDLYASLPAHGDGAPVDGVTGVDNASKQYVNDDPQPGEAVLYLNIGTLAVPQWVGVITA